MANETILIVDADTKSQKVLEVSFKKAGYRVVMTDGPTRARELVRDVSPDIIISDTQFPGGGDGFEFLADIKQVGGQGVPFIFLTEERALPQKMKGFELGADDYLTKPIYIKEVTTRVDLLLQKRAKEQLTKEDVEEIEGNLDDITMIDLLQTIEEELRSGTIHLTRETQSAVIYFREGNILDAICGKLQGEEAIYRLMLWPDGEFVLRYHDQVRRIDRIEKDSGALLLEGIRRLDEYNDLVGALPNLARVFEADYGKLADVVDRLPSEVAQVTRLFDGLRSIREVTDGSPLDDVTTLRIVGKLIEDGYLQDVTPGGHERERKPSRSNLAAWLDGARAPENRSRGDVGVREDTSPKFGSSITDMVGQRPERTTQMPKSSNRRRQTIEGMRRKAGDTDEFIARSADELREARDEERIRQTIPLADAVDSLDSLDELPVEPGGEKDPDERRRTMLQWDRGRSDWNVHLDQQETSDAAIREIEEEERRRREEEARHIADVTRDATLRFAPAVDRDAGPAAEEDAVARELEEDERRRREVEAERLQNEMGGREPVEAPEKRGPRRRTDELPSQSEVPSLDDAAADDEVDTDELFGLESPGGIEPLRERTPTPLSSPASATLAEATSDATEKTGGTEEEIPMNGGGLGSDFVSEADVFEDSDEVDRQPDTPGDADSRVTKDIRPPAELTPLGVEANEPEVTPEIDAAGLFDDLGDEETSPGESLQEISAEMIEPLPSVERLSTDGELVHAEYDLSRRSTVPPWKVNGRIEESERHPTMELDGRGEPAASQSTAPEKDFYAEAQPQYDYFEDLEAETSDRKGWLPIVLITAVVLGAVVYLAVKTPPSETDVPEEIVRVEPPPPIEPPEPVEPIVAPEPLATPSGLDAAGAADHAAEYGGQLMARTAELALLMSGDDVLEVSPETTPEGETPDEPVVAATGPGETEAPDVRTTDEPVREQTAPPTKVTKATAGKIKEAERMVQRERYGDALQLLRQLSEADPENGKIAYLHGLTAFNTNRTGESVTHLSRAERLGHRTADLYLHLAAAYNVDGKKSQAKWAYEKFLSMQPDGRVADEVRTILSTQF